MNASSHRQKTFESIALIVTGYCAYSVADLCAKILQETYGIYQILSVSGFIGLAVTSAWLWLAHGPRAFFPANARAHIMRGLFVLGTAYFMVRALKTLPLADFYGIVFIMPFLVMILAILFLGEKVGWRRWTAAMVGFSGVLLIAGPQFQDIGEGFVCALLGALCAAANIIMVRKIGKDVPIPLYGFYPFLFIFTFNALMLLASGSYIPLEIKDIFYFAFHGPVIIVGIVFVSLGFAIAPVAAVVAPFHYTQIIWGILFGWLFYSAVPTATTGLGIALIIAAGLYSLWREYRLSQKI